MRCVASIIATFLIAACTASKPDYDDFLNIETRAGLREKIGEPDSFRSSPNYPDVSSLSDPPLKYSQIEQWTYDSTKDGVSGKALFWFYVNEQDTEELFESWNWLSDLELRRRGQ